MTDIAYLVTFAVGIGSAALAVATVVYTLVRIPAEDQELPRGLLHREDASRQSH